jgi:glycosyltransferase involved in cell wall biosynthesis
VLIDAVALMRHRDAVQVTIAGAGPELRSLQDRARQLGIADRLKFVGELDPARIPEFLSDADVFVLASRSEGRPNVVIEALAAGLPVVSSTLPGIDGLVQPGINGWCATIGDAAEFAAALDEAFADPAERERRGGAARDEILRGGRTWTVTSQQYESVFRRALLAHRQGAT